MISRGEGSGEEFSFFFLFFDCKQRYGGNIFALIYLNSLCFGKEIE